MIAKSETVVSPAVRQRDVERKLRRVLALLKQAEPGRIVKTCGEIGITPYTFRRYRGLYSRGGEDAVRKALNTRRVTIFQDD